MNAPKVTLVTIAVSGPYDNGKAWVWEVDGPGEMLHAHAATEARPL